MLTCSCSDWESFEWYYNPPSDYSVFKEKRRQRCYSCNSLINIGETATKFKRWRAPRDEIESRIYGEDLDCGVPLASKWFCEKCSDLYFTFYELGYCLSPLGNMMEMLEEYHELVHEKQNPESLDD